jgi:hypothetical protein
MVARTLLAMTPPPPEKVIPIRLRQAKANQDGTSAVAKTGKTP